MGTTVVTAAETFLRLAFFDLGRKHRHLLCQFAAAAMGTLSLGFITAAFQQLGYLAAVIAFIFVYRHLCRFQGLVSLLKGFML
jgi:uncharacterized membrane protein YqjE